MKDLADKFGLQEEAIYQELKKKKHAAGSRQSNINSQPPAIYYELSTTDRNLVSILVNVDQSLLEVIANQIDRLDIQNPISKEIIQKILQTRLSGNELSAIIDDLSNENVRKIFAELSFATPQRSKGWEDIRPGSETPDYLKWISQLLISFEVEQIEQKIKNA